MNWLFAILVIAVSAFAYREGGRPKKVNPYETDAIRKFVPKYKPGRTRKVPKFLARGMTAFCVALLATQDQAAIAIITLALALGFTAAPGNAVAPAFHGIRPDLNKRERWQIGPLLDNAWLSLVVLGMIRAFGVLAILAYNKAYWPIAATLLIASVIATPASVLIARVVNGGKLTFETGLTLAWAKETIRSNRMWGFHEYCYGGLLALLTFIGIRLI